jgi:predicted GIY-YIG superfamily endonuclease
MDVDSDGDNVRSEEMSFTDDNEEIRDGDDVIDGVNLENYVTMSEEHEYLVDDTHLLQNNEDNNGDQESVTFTDFIPTTNAGEIAVAVEEKTKYGFKFAGSNILNNVGSLLARSGFDICKSRYVNHNIQKLCSVTNCESIPIVYPEGMLFPSIHWKCSVDKCSILGAIPSSLLNANANKYGFASIPQHIRTRLTCPSCTTSSDPRYITHCYDVMANMAASQCDTRLVINRGLTVGKEIYGNLGVRGNIDSTLLGSVDSKQMVKNLCTSQKYVKWDYFLTFTANQSCHFGLKPIRKWIENKGWASIYPGYNDLNETYQREIDDAVNQASAGLMLRVWEEVSILFLEFITKSPHSPYLNVKATFARREYQSNSGNLAHSHIIIGINEAELTREQKAFVDNLACGSVFDVVRCDNIEKYIKKGIIHSQDEIPPLVDNAIAFLTHKCSNRCLVKTSTGQLRCRMPQYMRMTPDNSKQNFVDLPITISDECWKRLHRIGLANDVLNVKGERNVFKSLLGYFHPKRWIPAVVPGEAPVSPFEGQTFAVCKSMQNCQRLDEAGGCCKYTCKYLGKIDKQNYVTISMSKTKKDGSIQSNSTYLHNTKITASDIQQEKEKNTKRDKHHPDGRCVSLTEMLHVMLQYHEVYTDLIFVSISTMPLELRCSQKLVTDAETEDGMYTDTVSSLIRSQKTHFPQWRKHSISEIIIMNDIKQSKMGYDKVTQFSLRPCELKTIVDMVGHYYRWFIIEMKQKLTGEEMDTLLNDDLRMSPWIDGLQRKVKLRKTALPEILEWCSYLETEESDQTQGRVIMIQLIRDINTVISETRDILNEDDSQFLSFILKHLIYDDSKEDHLPIPVFSYIRPNNAVQFLNHILISMGRFSTEIDLMTHGSIKKSFQHAKLIGNEDTEDKLVEYSNDLLKKYITEQVRYFPNSIKTIDAFIIMAGEVFDNAIIKNAIAMTDMPPVQFSLLARSMEDKMIKNRRESLKKTIDAIYIELDELINTCNIPPKEELLNATLNNPCNWDPIASFTKGINQSEESFNEQKFAIQTCIQAIDSITNLSDQLTMTKSIVIRGHPGAGKSFCMMYVIVYAICQGLFQTPVAKMTHRGLQIGGINWDKLLGLRGSENNVGIHRRAELAIARLKRERIKEDVLLSLNILFADELGQLSAEELSLFEMILRNVRGSSSFMGGVLVIGTMDHLQIQPINGRPFLTANSIIPCFKMVALRNTVRATGDLYVELQSLVRRDYRDFGDEPQLLTRIRRICSDIFTFVDNWNHEKITPHTFRVFSKKFPGKEALNEFQSRLFRKYNNNPGILRQRSAQDFQKSRYGHDWMVASEETSNTLDKKCREPKLLLFEVGLVYTCTFNDNKKSNSQKAILFDLPTQETLDNFGGIKVLLAPPGCKDVSYIVGETKQYYFDRNFKEVTIECTPKKIFSLSNNQQAMRKQYGLQHYVAGTIHYAMGDTIPSLVTSLSMRDRNFNMWDKGQLLVIISRTKKAEDTIFVGNKEDTLDAMMSILRTRTQWTDYMESILKVVTINQEEEDNETRGTMDNSTFPFRPCDISLPTDSSGYVYILISLRSREFFYIGKTKDLHQRMRAHQSGHGSLTTQPEYLRPYAYYAYICGFDGNEHMMFYVEQQLKESITQLRGQGINDPRVWANIGGNAVLNLDLSNFGLRDTRDELRLVLLFK